MVSFDVVSPHKVVKTYLHTILVLLEYKLLENLFLNKKRFSKKRYNDIVHHPISSIRSTDVARKEWLMYFVFFDYAYKSVFKYHIFLINCVEYLLIYDFLINYSCSKLYSNRCCRICSINKIYWFGTLKSSFCLYYLCISFSHPQYRFVIKGCQRKIVIKIE